MSFQVLSLLALAATLSAPLAAATFTRSLDLAPSALRPTPVPDALFGANIGYWSEVNGPALAASAAEAGITVFRYHPGTYHDPHTVPGAINQWDFTAVDDFGAQRLADFGRFLLATGTTGQIHINYGAGSPAQAAALLAYLRVPLDAPAELLDLPLGSAVLEPSILPPYTRTRDWRSVGFWARLRASAPLAVDDGFNKLRLNHPTPFPILYFECGNEADYSFVPCLRHRLPGENSITQGATGYGGRRADAHTYANFYAATRALLLQIDPAIEFGASAGYFTQAGDDTDSPAVPFLFPGPSGTTQAWTPVMLTRLRELGVTPDFIIAHRYTRQTDFAWNNDYLLRGALHAYLAPGQGALPRIHVTEINWAEVESVPFTTTIDNAVNLARSFADALQHDVHNLSWFTFTSGSANHDPASPTGWRKYHNWGLIADDPLAGQTPNPAALAWPGLFPGARFPTFHAFALLQDFARPGDTIYRASALSPENTNSHDLTVFAARRASGDYTFLVLNRATTTHNLDLTLASADLSGHATTLLGSRYGRAQDEEQRLKSLQTPPILTNNTRESFTLARSGSALAYAAPPLSVTVLRLPVAPASPPQITSAPGVVGTREAPFSHQLTATGGGLTFHATSLPPGLVFDVALARITGIPSAAGDFTIPVTATNSAGTASQTLHLGIRDRVSTTLYAQDFSGAHGWWSYQGDTGVTGSRTAGPLGPDGLAALEHTITVTPPAASYWYAGVGVTLPTPAGLTLANLHEYRLTLRLRSSLAAAAPFDLGLKSAADQSLTYRATVPGQTWTEVSFPLDAATLANLNPAASSIELLVAPASALWPLASASYRVADVRLARLLPQDTPLQAWRRLHFGDILPLGPAADSADPDTDGLPNLLEYALARDPLTPSAQPPLLSSLTPSLPHSLRLTFFRARPDLAYIIEASSDLRDEWLVLTLDPGEVGEWVTVEDNPAEPSPRFFRLRVTRL